MLVVEFSEFFIKVVVILIFFRFNLYKNSYGFCEWMYFKVMFYILIGRLGGLIDWVLDVFDDEFFKCGIIK